MTYLGGTAHLNEGPVPVIYLALFGPAVALPALLVLDRYERWAVRHRDAARTR